MPPVPRAPGGDACPGWAAVTETRWGVAPESASTESGARRGGPTRGRDEAMNDDFECFAGIDWATEAHQVCLVDRAGVILGERSFAHSGAGLAALCDWLVATGGGSISRTA